MHPPSAERGEDTPAPLDADVLICTYNRADRLGESLDALARTRVSALEWGVTVVDNNSTDHTRDVVAARAATYPVSLRYLFEPRQGKSSALNAGLRATNAPMIVFTDDDVQVDPEWLEAACRPLMTNESIDYTGGPVAPIWEGRCPPWLADGRTDLWGTLAVLDYGREPFIFEERRRVPLGVNMAVRRRLIDRIGGFHPSLGRTGRSLLGQEQAEFFARSRSIGARGLYVPEMKLAHHVPASRLTRSYFRRWWYWKGRSRQRLEQMHHTTELGLDLSSVPRVGAIPRFMIGSAVRDAVEWMRALATRDVCERARREMMLCYFGGYLRAALGAGSPA